MIERVGDTASREMAMNTLPPRAERIARQFQARRNCDFTLSTVGPCYDEEEVIHTTVAKLRETAALVTPQFELIFVDDGSVDLKS